MSSLVQEIIGISGMTMILCSFLLNQFQIWTHESFAYDLVNFIGSFLLIIYSVELESLPFTILNVVWAAVSLKDIYIFVKLKK